MPHQRRPVGKRPEAAAAAPGCFLGGCLLFVRLVFAVLESVIAIYLRLFQPLFFDGLTSGAGAVMILRDFPAAQHRLAAFPGYPPHCSTYSIAYLSSGNLCPRQNADPC